MNMPIRACQPQVSLCALGTHPLAPLLAPSITACRAGVHPHQGIDPIIVACHLGTALQTVVSRMVSPMETAVVSVTRIQAGTSHNIIPEVAYLSGTVRAMNPATMTVIEQSIRRLVFSIASGFGAEAEIDYRVIFAPTVNNAAEAALFADAAADLVGEENVQRDGPPTMASEDFGFMLERVPGAHMFLGNGDSPPVHNHLYDFNDDAIPYGAGLLARIVERRMPRGDMTEGQ